MSLFKKTPQERYEDAFDKALYAMETRGPDIEVSCGDSPILSFPRTDEGYNQAAAFLEERKRPLLERMVKRGRIF